MLLVTLSKSLNRLAGPYLLRSCIRSRASKKGYKTIFSRLMFPVATSLLSMEMHEESKSFIEKAVQDIGSENQVNRPAIQLSTLSRYVRKALVPTETWSDIRKWQFNPDVQRWVGFEYLKAKYGYDIYLALVVYPYLLKSPQISGTVLSNPNRGMVMNYIKYGSTSVPIDIVEKKTNSKGSLLAKLPSTQQLVKAFQMEDWSNSKMVGASYVDMTRIVQNKLGGDALKRRGGSIRFALVKDEATSTEGLSFEDILEVGGIPVLQGSVFNLVCQLTKICQFWTREYIEELGQYLRTQADSYDGETVILEVGAGDGVLSQCLRDYFETAYRPNNDNPYQKRRNGAARQQQRQKKNGKPPLIVASDSNGGKRETKAEVFRYDVSTAIDMYCNTRLSDEVRQVIVISSWMPQTMDWTAKFRKANVDEYILIGEADDGHFGSNWTTWGNYYFHKDYGLNVLFSAAVNEYHSNINDDAENNPLGILPLPLYEADGYVRKNLDNLTKYQFSRFDSKTSKKGQTVSFRRGSIPKARED